MSGNGYGKGECQGSQVRNIHVSTWPSCPTLPHPAHPIHPACPPPTLHARPCCKWQVCEFFAPHRLALPHPAPNCERQVLTRCLVRPHGWHAPSPGGARAARCHSGVPGSFVFLLLTVWVQAFVLSLSLSLFLISLFFLILESLVVLSSM